MKQGKIRHGVLAAVVAGSLLLTTGCDPTTQTTLENGVISASQSLFGAFLRAVLEIGAEQQDPNQAQ